MEPDTASAHINLGNTLRAGGMLDEAGAHYLKALDIEPSNTGARINLGNILRVRGRLDEAAAHYLKALDIEPDNAGAHINLGGILCARGRLDEAAAHYLKALDIEPRNAGAHINLGNVFQARGQLDEATAHYGEALRIIPGHVGAHINLGNILQARGKFHDAIAHYRIALPMDPRNGALYNNLGGAILGAHGDLNHAAACFERALSLEPHYAEAHFNLGNVFRDQGKPDEALSCFEQAIGLRPDRADFHSQLANALRDKGKLEPAKACCERALALDPNYAEAHYNLGNVFGDQGKLDDALGCYERALTLKPDYADAHTNLIVTLRDQGRFNDAMACCKRALSLCPDSADVNYCDAYFRLLTADFVEGWRKYEWRWLTKGVKALGLIAPLWDGKDLRSRTILLHCEQGLGDSIQCVRFARLVKEKGGEVLLACPASLAGLFKGVAGIDRIFPGGCDVPDYDVHAPLMSLPGLFETTLNTIPADPPYLQADPGRVGVWRNRLASYHGFRVGIAWRGRPTHPDDRRRSMTAAQFTEFLKIPGLAFVSLQQDATAGEVETLGDTSGSFFDAGPFLKDFGETASVMANLDLVITVDTAVCHLAGALAVPVWTLIPFVPDWRWLLQRDDSPWYPVMRLFRQPRVGDWQSVLERVREELTLLTERGGSRK